MLRALLQGFTHRGRRAGEAAAPPPPTREGAPTDVIKEPPMQIDGRCMQADEFVAYVEGLDFPNPSPTRVFVHHTWRPGKADWAGHDSLMAMKRIYETYRWNDEQGRVHEGWTTGPHLYVADDGIWLFSDLRNDGVGVYGQNYRSRHLEMVGNYDDEMPSGATLQNVIAALGILHARLGLDIERLNFHRDFAANTCPGRAVQKNWLIPQVGQWITTYRQKQEQTGSAVRQALLRMIADQIVPTNPNFALPKAAAARGLLGAISHEVPMEIDGQAYVVQFYAEALLVKVGQWDKVQSLKEHEQARPRAVAVEGGVGVPPSDSFDFQGEIR